jgi:hypothetical protein
MANKTLHEYSIPTIANIPARPTVNMGDTNFELKIGLIMMVQANPFYGLPNKDANTHIRHFLELCDTIITKDVAPEIIRLYLFPFSLLERVKQWFGFNTH